MAYGTYKLWSAVMKEQVLKITSRRQMYCQGIPRAVRNNADLGIADVRESTLA